MTRYVYEYRNEGPDIRHVLREPDATLCEEYVDGEDGFSNQQRGVIQVCPVCDHLAWLGVIDRARSDAARELGVDKSEVF